MTFPGGMITIILLFDLKMALEQFLKVGQIYPPTTQNISLMMNNKFSPLHQGNRIVPNYPSEKMSLDIKYLWEHFSKTLNWGGSLESRITFEFLINAREFSKGRVILDAGAGHQRYKPFFDTSIYLSQEHPSGIEFKKMQGFVLIQKPAYKPSAFPNIR